MNATRELGRGGCRKRRRRKSDPEIDDEDIAEGAPQAPVQAVPVQDWIVHAGLRVVIVFEGRDAAGKGGMIKAIMERVSPRVFRLVALPGSLRPRRTQIYVQRYLQHFPAAGEVVIFDRSWYNRAGVEYVMGFCSKCSTRPFWRTAPGVSAIFMRRG